MDDDVPIIYISPINISKKDGAEFDELNRDHEDAHEFVDVDQSIPTTDDPISKDTYLEEQAKDVACQRLASLIGKSN